MNSSHSMGTFDQGHSQIPWTILKSNISFQTTVIIWFRRHKTIWVLLIENTLSFFSQAEEWQPLLVYRNSLVHGEGEVPVVPSKRPYARKRKYGSDDDDDDDDADYV